MLSALLVPPPPCSLSLWLKSYAKCLGSRWGAGGATRPSEEVYKALEMVPVVPGQLGLSSMLQMN
jgi:hypothetical protein